MHAVKGREGVTDFLQLLLKALPDLQVNVEDIFATEKRVALRVTLVGTHQGEFQDACMQYKSPTEKEVRQYISLMRRDWLERVRHYLIIPHAQENLTKKIHLALKYAYLYLSYRMFLETGRLPKTRKETIFYFKERESQDLGMRLIKIQDNWDSHKEDVARKPESYLFLLEEFFRRSRP